MTLLKNIESLSNIEISEKIIEIEMNLFNLHFKKATSQNFKSHEFKLKRRHLAQLKTFLTIRLQNIEQSK